MIAALMTAATLGTMPLPAVPLRGDMSSYPSLADVTAVTAARVALTVDASGRPLRCDVVAPSTSARLDRVGCALLLHTARFRAAVDDGGAPVAAVVEHVIAVNGGTMRPRAVDFAVPVSRLAASPGTVADARVVTDTDGRIASCTIATGSGVAALDRLVCPGIAVAVLPPARAADGSPLRAVRLVGVGFAVGEVARRID